MADHPSSGVVDANLQVFGMANLFICDGSTFATAGSANPTLTITALGLRFGQHLAAGVRPVTVSAAESPLVDRAVTIM